MNKYREFVLYFDELDKQGISWSKSDLIEKSRELGIENLYVKEIRAKESKEFVIKYHYSRTCPNGTYRFGLYYNGDLIGVAVFGQVIGRYQSKKYYDKPNELIELRRLVLIDDTPRYMESRFISICINKLKKKRGISAILSLADTNFGHLGIIYKASGFKLIGKTEKDGHPRIFIDGVERHPRDLYDKEGTSSIKKLVIKYGNRIRIVSKIPKIIYIYLMRKSNKKVRSSNQKKSDGSNPILSHQLCFKCKQYEGNIEHKDGRFYCDGCSASKLIKDYG